MMLSCIRPCSSEPCFYKTVSFHQFLSTAFNLVKIWARTKGPLSQPWNLLILAMYHDGEKIEQVLMMMMKEQVRSNKDASKKTLF